MANDSANTPPSAEFLSPQSGDSALAPWAGRRMYASGHPGAKGSGADETELGRDLGVAETTIWGSFMTRLIKK